MANFKEILLKVKNGDKRRKFNEKRPNQMNVRPKLLAVVIIDIFMPFKL